MLRLLGLLLLLVLLRFLFLFLLPLFNFILTIIVCECHLLSHRIVIFSYDIFPINISRGFYIILLFHLAELGLVIWCSMKIVILFIIIFWATFNNILPGLTLHFIDLPLFTLLFPKGCLPWYCTLFSVAAHRCFPWMVRSRCNSC